jgi:hypothetical protein
MAGVSSEELSAAAGIVLSLGFSYIPGVSQRFDGLTPTQKRLVMLGLLLACALGVFGLSCLKSGWVTAPTCNRAGAWGLAKVFVAALIANQAAFAISPRGGRKTEEAGPQAVESTAAGETGPKAVQSTVPRQERPGAAQRKMYIRRPVSRQSFQTVHHSAKNKASGQAPLVDQRDAYGTDHRQEQQDAGDQRTTAKEAGSAKR